MSPRVDQWTDTKAGINIGRGRSSCSSRHGARKTSRGNRSEERSSGQQFKERSPIIQAICEFTLGQHNIPFLLQLLLRPAGCCARRVVIDTSPRTKNWWKSLAADSAYEKDLFDTDHTHRATPKLGNNCRPEHKFFLEQELQGNLHDTRIAGTSYITETTLAGVVDESIRIHKLRMIEDIECFGPKLQLSGLSNGSTL